MDVRLRQKEDPEDVLQSVYHSFFVRQARGEFDLRDWDSLWSLLATITLHKCGHRVEHFQAARRDVRREVAPPTRDDPTASWEGIAREPTPQEAAVLSELLEQTMRGLEGYQRQILELKPPRTQRGRNQRPRRLHATHRSAHPPTGPQRSRTHARQLTAEPVYLRHVRTPPFPEF